MRGAVQQARKGTCDELVPSFYFVLFLVLFSLGLFGHTHAARCTACTCVSMYYEERQRRRPVPSGPAAPAGAGPRRTRPGPCSRVRAQTRAPAAARPWPASQTPVWSGEHSEQGSVSAMPCAPCPVPRAPCPVPRAPCPVPRAPRRVPCMGVPPCSLPLLPTISKCARATRVAGSAVGQRRSATSRPRRKHTSPWSAWPANAYARPRLVTAVASSHVVRRPPASRSATACS